VQKTTSPSPTTTASDEDTDAEMDADVPEKAEEPIVEDVKQAEESSEIITDEIEQQKDLKIIVNNRGNFVTHTHYIHFELFSAKELEL
jgi:ornithine cyclodeaminase/alanine dehydrogenase-like protein (mu-crystallin family)